MQVCSFCDQHHLSAKCNVVTDIAARRLALRKKGKCFGCLKSGHIASNCPTKSKCPKCGYRHHVALCEGVKKKEDQKPVGQGDEKKTSESSRNGASATLCINSSTSVLLQTARAIVGKPGDPRKKVQARIVFDSCSQRSYISKRLQDALKLPAVTSDNLLVKTFANESPRLMSCDMVQISITAMDGLKLYINAYSATTVCSPISNQEIDIAMEKNPYLGGLTLAEEVVSYQDSEVDVLIGADYYWNFVTNVSRRGAQPGPVALLTKLGWVLSGPVNNDCHDEPNCTTNLNATHVLRVDSTPIQREPDPDVREQLKTFWDLETLGIRDEEKSVYDDFVEEIQFNGERYEAHLPFKKHHPVIPDNHAGSVKRLVSLLRRLQNQPTLLREYDRIIRDQLDNGIIERIPPETEVKVGNVHYLPQRLNYY